MTANKYSFLALGDSYTIGQSVSADQNFPAQTVKLLQTKGYPFVLPQIIARTGWTTQDLLRAVNTSALSSSYTIVTLLIGVNDQYRGGKISDYAQDFEQMLQQAIHLAGGDTAHVFVLSIPDWSVTPFASTMNTVRIAREINQFNRINNEIAARHHVHYLNITPDTQQAAQHPELLAGDGLHPSAIEYAMWTEALSDAIAQNLP